jgi:hypothetical protein
MILLRGRRLAFLLAAVLFIVGCRHASSSGETAGPDQSDLAGGLVSATRTRRLLYRCGKGLLQRRRPRRHDLAVGSYLDVDKQVAAGVAQFGLQASDHVLGPYRVMLTKRDFLQQHPDLVAKFVRALLRGWRENMNDPAPAHALISKLNPALTPDWMQFSWQALCDGHFVTGDDPAGAQMGQMSPDRWTTMYNQLLDLKVIDKPFDPAAAYTLQFVQQPN